MHSSHGNGGTHVHTCTWQPRHQRKQTWQPEHHATFQEAMALQHTHHGSMASKHTRMHGITPHTPMAAMASTQTDMEAMSSQHTHTHTHGSHSITARAPMALEQTNMLAAAMARCTHTMSWQLSDVASQHTPLIMAATWHHSTRHPSWQLYGITAHPSWQLHGITACTCMAAMASQGFTENTGGWRRGGGEIAGRPHKRSQQGQAGGISSRCIAGVARFVRGATWEAPVAMSLSVGSVVG